VASLVRARATVECAGERWGRLLPNATLYFEAMMREGLATLIVSCKWVSV